MAYELIQSHPAIFRVSSDLIEHRLDPIFFQPKYAKLDAAVSGSPFEVVEIGSKRVTTLFTHMPGFSRDRWVEYIPEGIPYLLQINVQEGYIEPTGWQYITPSAHANLQTSSLQQGNVLLTATGAHYGKAAVVPEWLPPANACPDVFRVVMQKWINPYYTVAYLNCDYGQAELRRHGSGANRPRIITEYARKVRLVLPPRQVQDYIGAKMHLAEQCRQRARELRETARKALADEICWPVPLDDKIGSFVHPQDITDRLDSKYYRKSFLTLVDLIERYPEGSEPLENLIQSIANGVEYRQFVEEGRPYLTVSDISDGRINARSAPRIPRDVSVPVKGLTKTFDVLVVRTGSIGQAAFIALTDAGCVISSHFIRLRLQDPKDGPWVALYLNSEIGALLQQRIVYGAVQPQIRQNDLLGLPVPRLPAAVKAKIGDSVITSNRLFTRAEQLIEEAKADVEALIEGRLDVEGILAGRVQAPTVADIEGL